MARAAVRLGVREVAELAGVAPYTISRFETEQGGLRLDTSEKLKTALSALGVRFTNDEQGRSCICYVPPSAGAET
ncbi:helix-turn-helix transcriptional regulator [Methylobacterium longum]|uniref:Helix-turn-helix transcriptional regulator n=1 Tax=Methylobacterium longum TaxID=767694 RepID=A0ABT8AT35_9HYPH|nr:helix-turn-helix transcriptional regulator [Methylobacterium longum]MDN3572959.1 helix-turn-helix transcriptional regulator [Methylobacterium longum]